MFDQRIEWLLGEVGVLEAKDPKVLHWERQYLRELAKQVADIAHLPIMGQRREMWTRHNGMERVRPMILVFPEGSWRELLPASALRCESAQARRCEWALRRRIYYHESIHDDMVIEDSWIVSKRITDTGWGLEAKHRPSDQENGAWAFDPVIKTESDLDKLRYPQVIYDQDGSDRDLEFV